MYEGLLVRLRAFDNRDLMQCLSYSNDYEVMRGASGAILYPPPWTTSPGHGGRTPAIPPGNTNSPSKPRRAIVHRQMRVHQGQLEKPGGRTGHPDRGEGLPRQGLRHRRHPNPVHLRLYGNEPA